MAFPNPTWLFHRTAGARLFQSAEQHAKAGLGWRDRPYELGEAEDPSETAPAYTEEELVEQARLTEEKIAAEAKAQETAKKAGVEANKPATRIVQAQFAPIHEDVMTAPDPGIKESPLAVLTGKSDAELTEFTTADEREKLNPAQLKKLVNKRSYAKSQGR